MKVEIYLKQGRLLDQKINCNLRRLQEMKAGVCSISSPIIHQDKVQQASSGDAPFVKALIRIDEMQEHINREVDQLVDLRTQMDETIRSVDSDKHQLVLIYRYLEGKSWEQIAQNMNAGKSTVKRWHNEAIQMVKMPEEPIYIKGFW